MQDHVNLHTRRIVGAVVTFFLNLESCWRQNLGIFTKGNSPLSTSQPSTWGSQRGALSSAIKRISGTVAGDSSLQDRGGAHYLLPLLFSLVSLLSSFCFRVLYQRPQKN